MNERTIILPPRIGESEKEKRMRATIDQLGGQILQAMDTALDLRSRTASQDVQKARHIARAKMVEMALSVMNAVAYREAARITPETQQG